MMLVIGGSAELRTATVASFPSFTISPQGPLELLLFYRNRRGVLCRSLDSLTYKVSKKFLCLSFR